MTTSTEPNYGDTPDHELFWGSPDIARAFIASPQPCQAASSRIRRDLERGLDLLNRAYCQSRGITSGTPVGRP